MNIKNKLLLKIDAIKCALSKHLTPPKHAVAAFGAVFQGGKCERCKKIVQGKFICNMWDDKLTEEKEINGEKIILLKGANPKLAAEGWLIVHTL